ncbi:hypothetical protein MUO98_06205, partial [Candidatus Bathyarchaeota archaeon]|nr:hypothetical protein [Candidatus Bathyarchaeota archaeon]
TADPTHISSTGNSTITVQLFDQNSAPVSQPGIIITVSLTFSTNKPPILNYQSQSGSTVIVTTDSSGKAVITLVGQGKAGTATIVASSSGLNSGNSTVILQ